MPRRRRGAKAVALDTETERNLVMRMLLHSPKDTVAGFLAFAAVSAIIVNALFLQAGHHPAPMFGTVITLPAASPLPRPRPAEADALSLEPKPMEYRTVEPNEKPVEPKPSEAKSVDSLTSLVKATTGTISAPSANVLRPPAPIPASPASRRIAAVQRVLTEYGYGQLKPTGIAGADTQAAILKFEREHKLAVTGQVSERLVRELSAAIGHSVE